MLGIQTRETVKNVKMSEKFFRMLLTFAALLFADGAGVFQIVESEDVLHLSLSVDD